MAIRGVTGTSGATQRVHYFRVESDRQIFRGSFELCRGISPALTAGQFDTVTVGTVILHFRNCDSGSRGAVLGISCWGGKSAWQHLCVAEVFQDPRSWVNKTLDTAAKHLFASRGIRHDAAPNIMMLTHLLSPDDRVLLTNVLPRLVNALKAHCCEEGEDDLRDPPFF